MGRNSQRLSLLISRSIRSRSPAGVKPHQEGEAYIKDEIVVALYSNLLQLGSWQAMAAENPESITGRSTGTEDLVQMLKSAPEKKPAS